MVNHFSLTEKEFHDNSNLFNVLEIKARKVVGKNHQQLTKILKEQHKKLILVNHPDKGGDKHRFNQIYKAYQELKKYIEPLELGDPCVKVSIDAESDGRLTIHEFYYRKKLFDTLNITQEEAVGKTYDQLISMLHNKDNSLKQAKKECDWLKTRIMLISQNPVLSPLEKLTEVAKLVKELKKQLAKPCIKLFDYFAPLEKKGSPINEDKKVLAQKFIERKNGLISILSMSIVLLALLTTITICCYFSLWILAFNTAIGMSSKALVNRYMEKYKNSEISTDEFINKMNYISLASKFLINYPLAAFSVYLLTTNFIANGLTIGGVILSPLLFAAILIEALAPIFAKGSEVYTEKYTRDLLEEDPRDRVQKATDLLKWYDPRKLLMPIIMPFVKKYFAELAGEFAERNLDGVDSDMQDVSTEQPFTPQIAEFAQPNVTV